MYIMFNDELHMNIYMYTLHHTYMHSICVVCVQKYFPSCVSLLCYHYGSVCHTTVICIIKHHTTINKNTINDNSQCKQYLILYLFTILLLISVHCYNILQFIFICVLRFVYDFLICVYAGIFKSGQLTKFRSTRIGPVQQTRFINGSHNKVHTVNQLIICVSYCN